MGTSSRVPRGAPSAPKHRTRRNTWRTVRSEQLTMRTWSRRFPLSRSLESRKRLTHTGLSGRNSSCWAAERV